MEEKSLRKRLNETFGRYHYVPIKNITKEVFKWPVALEQNEILNMSPVDNQSEDQMARKGGDTFLPMDGVTKDRTRVVEYELEPGQQKHVPGEAAYVLIPRLLHKAIREKYGNGKAGLSKLSVPSYQDEFLGQIIAGAVVKNVESVVNDYAASLGSKIENGFSSVEAQEPKSGRKGQAVKS